MWIINITKNTESGTIILIHTNTYGGTFRNLTAACVTFAIAVALLLDKYLG